jgi:Heparinase II/III-like protein
VNAEAFWSLVWYDPKVKSVPIQQQSTWHHFRDHDVVFWRSDWTPNATAFAFKCGPSEGHHTKSLLEQVPDWRLSSGHAHPDANSFIIFARGEYLSGDTGYAGGPMTEHHNTLLFAGKGQAKEGKGHDAFATVSYERLDRIRISELKVEKDFVSIRGDATSAYEPELGVKRFVRQFEYRPDQGFLITDEVETEKPTLVTSVVHADAGLQKETNDRFGISIGNAKLMIEVLEPKQFQSEIVVNTVRAPGPPGAVDKGENQERGEKLLISTLRTVTKTRFQLRLKVLKDPPDSTEP